MALFLGLFFDEILFICNELNATFLKGVGGFYFLSFVFFVRYENDRLMSVFISKGGHANVVWEYGIS